MNEIILVPKTKKKYLLSSRAVLFFTAIVVVSQLSSVLADESLRSTLIFSTNSIEFPDGGAGTVRYTEPILISNSGDQVTLKITGTDFYDSSSSGTRCPTTNSLALSRLSYYAWIGDYNTSQDSRADSEGYINLSYGSEANDPQFPLQDLISNHSNLIDGLSAGIIFRMNIPVPCYGNYDTGAVHIWEINGEGLIERNDLEMNRAFVSNPPYVVKCGNTTYFDDSVDVGRISTDELIERRGYMYTEGGEDILIRYFFEGETISWGVLVTDLSGINKVWNMRTTWGSERGPGNDYDGTIPYGGCIRNTEIAFNSCNIDQLPYNLTQFDPSIMELFTCRLTIESPDNVYRLFWATVEAQDYQNRLAVINESELIFVNPVVAISINDDISFENITSGKTVYSNTISIMNNADLGSGVVMDMFISGTDFTSSDESYTCRGGQTLSLSNFRYFAENGAYSTINDLEIGENRNMDEEGYININYGTIFNDPEVFYHGFELIQQDSNGEYYGANELEPSESMNLRFKLDVPEDCVGNFNNGNIFVWGEAI